MVDVASVRSLAWRLVPRAAPIFVGVVLGAAVVWSAPSRGTVGWYSRAALGLTLMVAAGAVFSYGWAYRRTLPGDGWSWALVLSVGALTVSAAVAYAYAASVGWRGPTMVLAVVAGGIPSAAALATTHRAVRRVEDLAIPGSQVARLIELREDTRHQLVPLGLLVALAVANLGAKTRLGFEPRTATTTPAGGILVFGALGTLLVAVFWVVAVAAINRQASRLCNDLVDLRTASDPQTIIERAEQRTKMAEVLGLNRETFQDLQTGLVVLGPLIASVFATVFKP